MKTIKNTALCLIVKNEENNIEKCLNSLKGMYAHAFITDTGSDDKTVNILSKRKDVTLSHFEWIDDFAAARNFNLDQVPSDYEWILWCDADDRIIDKDAVNKLQALQVPDNINSIDMPYIYTHSNYTVDQSIPNLQYYRKRLFRRGKCRWVGFIHEYPHVPGEEMACKDIVFHHYRKGTGVQNTKRNLAIFEKNLANMDDGNKARYLFYYGKELMYNNLYDEAKEKFLAYLSLSDWIPEKARAFYELGSIENKERNFKEARKWAFKCLQLEPHNSDACVLISYTYYQENDWQAAYLWAFHALYSDEEQIKFFDHIPNRTWVPLELMAWCRFNQGEKEKAIKLIKKALKYVPKHDYLLQTLKEWEKL